MPFTTSNGIAISVLPDGSLTIPDSLEGPELVRALREFFLAEHDERIGRWRHPYRTELVMYPDQEGEAVSVLNERTGKPVGTFTRATSAPNQPWFAYFAAHPAPTPWSRAAADEIWAVTAFVQFEPKIAETFPCTVTEAGFQPIAGGDAIPINSSTIEKATILWPKP